MTDAEGAWIAVRLVGAAAGLLLVPGLALLAALRIRAAWPEQTLLAFSASYAWVFALSIVVPLFEWTVDYAAILTIALVAALLAAAAFRPTPNTQHPRPKLQTVGSWGLGVGSVVPVIIVGAAVAGWVIAPPFTGEEALDFASLSRFADGGRITFDNTSLMPDTRAVYLVQPYQLALGAIARWAAVDPLIAFLKLRTVLAPLGLVMVYALLRSLLPTRAEAVAAFVVVTVCVALEIETWEVNSMFPFMARGTVTVAVLVPALMALAVIATRSVAAQPDRAVATAALAILPFALLAATATHALEVFTVLVFLSALVFAIIAGLDRGGDRRRAAMLVIAVAACLGTFLAIHARAVPFRAEWERAEKTALREGLPADATPGAIFRDLRDGGGSLFGRQSPLTSAGAIGIPILAIAVLRMPASAALIALAAVPLGVLYATRAGNAIVALVTSPQFSRDVGPYFMFMGLIGIALGTVALAQVLLEAVSRGSHRTAVGLTIVVLAGGTFAIHWLGGQASTRPDRFLLTLVVLATAVVGFAAYRGNPVVRATPFPLALAAVAATLAVPLAVPGLVFGGPYARQANASIVTRFVSALDRPSVLDGPEYYDELGRTIAPPLPVPGAIVDEIRRSMPPRQVLLANPAYSCALVAFVNAYCVNPAYIYGVFFQPAAPYLDRYVRRTADGAVEHPFFNSDAALRPEEATLLREYRISHVLSDPEHLPFIERKLAQAAPGARLIFERDGYRLYRIGT